MNQYIVSHSTSKIPKEHHKLEFNSKVLKTYNSIHSTYEYTEQFSNNIETYQEGTSWFGILLAFISGVFFTISSALVKGFKNVDPMILLSVRSIIQIIAMSVTAFKESINLFGPKDHRLLIQFQGLVGGITLSLLYYSFRKLPLGDVTTIVFSSPLIVILLSFLYLKEPCGILRVTVICALFAGVVLLARPPFLFQVYRNTHYDVTGYVCSLLATFFTAINIVIMRMCLEIHYSVIVLHLSVWSLIFAVLFFAFVPLDKPIGKFLDRLVLPDDWFTWEMMVMITMTGLLGQILVAKALKIEGAGKVSVTRSLDIIFAYIIQIYFFGEIPSITSASGALLILLSVICMGFEREIYRFCDFIP